MTLKSGLEGHLNALKLVPFESLGAVSYSPSIATMAVSLAVCGFGVFGGHLKWRGLIDHVRLSVGPPL